ncbi:MmgE/PrpD family protein [Methanobrevibacter olleyae]|uniref:2-methylcitrate dehydratase PrpD n=1 Tax=Methanobrevibacter olleyae TaxID=294671 RepID=A0A126QYL7_METOL|nr:MmgE/PrpD family protein [Methanobrevibacter olleyae]AMK14892.1 2-methylcitrate dehydratase PrpD [Methanobrevibacter olleyae]
MPYLLYSNYKDMIMIIDELSKYLIDLRYEDIPKESIEKAKLCFLDYLAVYFRGLETENSKIAIKTIFELYDNDFHDDFNLLNKGFINGIASHSLDLDDGHRLAQLHPGSVVFSTVLAMVCDSNLDLDISGEEFFEAIVLGYEVAIVLGMLVNPSHRNQGFHSTGTIGALTSGAVASKLLKLDLEKTEHCLALSTTQSSGLLEADHAGTMGKSLHAGAAVYNGILSAFLAKNGFTGGESLIDGKEGFLKAMATKSYDSFSDNKGDIDSLKISQFLKDNLNKFHINEAYLKKYPFCRHIHSAIDSALALKDDLNDLNSNSKLNYSDCLDLIKSIDVDTYKIASEHDNYNPKNLQDLKQSLPYAVAISLVSNDLSLDSIDELADKGLFDRVNFDNGLFDGVNFDKDIFDGKDFDKGILKIKETINKINIINNDEFNQLTPDKRPSKVIIKFKDNDFNSLNNLEYTTYYPLGEVENPLLLEDILEKFKLLNPKFNMNKLQIIKHMESKSIHEVFKQLDLLDNK